MKNLLNHSDLNSLMIRLNRIKPDTKARWGKMDAAQMIVHLRDPLLAAMGKRKVIPQSSILSTWPVNKLMALYLPWPKGAPTHPDFIQGLGGSIPESFEKDFENLLQTISEFASFKGTYAKQPVFGDFSNWEWARLMWRHINHHLKQFGV